MARETAGNELPQNLPAPPPPEVEVVQAWRVACDGGEGALGHPRVWLQIPADPGWTDCGYCDKRFVHASFAEAPGADLPGRDGPPGAPPGIL